MRTLGRTLVTAITGIGLLAGGACGTDDTTLTSTQQTLVDDQRESLTYRWKGQTEFISKLQSFWIFQRAFEDAAAADGAATMREIQEADIFEYDEEHDLLFTANAFRGLQIVSLANPDQPMLVGEEKVGGIPVELFVHENRAYVLLDSFRRGEPGTPQEQGALLRVYDVTRPEDPMPLASFPIAGRILGSHLLTSATSAVIYVVSEAYRADDPATPENEAGQVTYVQSISVTDPANPRKVSEVSFAGGTTAAMVTEKAVFVASYDWQTDTSRITYVDIADTAGGIRVRDSIEIAGRLQWGELGELQMDVFQGVLRVASEVMEQGVPSVRISTIDIENPDLLDLLDTLNIAPGESLLGVRFSEGRAYVFHATAVDPLEVLDLSNPENIQSLGLLRIQGFVTYIEARGTRLVALGVDSTDARRLALITFDVSDPQAPVEIARVAIGEQWAWSEALFDPRALRIIDELNLIVLPVESYSPTRLRTESFLQLVRFEPTTGQLEEAGRVDTIGFMRRIFAAGERLVTFGELALHVIDVTDAEKPEVTATVELVANPVDVVEVGERAVTLVTPVDEQQRTELRVLDPARPDERRALSRVAVNIDAGMLFALDNQHVAVVGDDTEAKQIRITIVNVANATAPRITGQLSLPMPAMSGPLPIDIMRPRYFSQPAIDANKDAIVMALPDAASGQIKLSVVTVTDRTRPRLTRTQNLGDVVLEEVKMIGARAHVSTYEPLAKPAETAITGEAKYRLHLVNLDQPYLPRIIGPVSVPGTVVGAEARQIGPFKVQVIYTNDMFKAADGREPVRGLDTLYLFEQVGVASLLDIHEVPMDASQIIAEGPFAYYTHVLVEEQPEPGELPEVRTMLHSLDLRRPEDIMEADELELPESEYAFLGAVEEGFAFIRVGWALVTVVDVHAPEALAPLGTFDAPGWFSSRAVVLATKALLPAGLFGIHEIPLAATPMPMP